MPKQDDFECFQTGLSTTRKEEIETNDDIIAAKNARIDDQHDNDNGGPEQGGLMHHQAVPHTF